MIRLILVPLGMLIGIPIVCLLFIRFVIKGLEIFKVKERNTPPKCLNNPELGTHKFMNVNGIKLHYVESGDADKPLILFIHGFPEFWYSWRFQIKHFQQNFRVVAFDMRGYGDSSKPAGIKNYTLDLLVEDVRALVSGLGVNRFHLVAHDWGAAVGWSFAALHPKMLKSYTSCNLPHPTSLKNQQKNSWEQRLKSWYILFFQCPILPELFTMSNDMVMLDQMFKDAGLDQEDQLLEAFKYTFKDFTAWNRTINFYRGILLNPEAKKFEKLLKKIQVPCLSIFGTGDKYLSVTAARESSKYVDDHKLELLEGVSHWVQQEAPDKVNQLIEAFVEKHA